MIRAVNFKNVKSLLISILISLGSGFLSSILSGDIKGVYESLAKPSFAPPPWVFSAVWTVLYILIGIAAYLIYKQGIKSPGVREALQFYTLSLIFAFFWTPFFFRWNLYLFSLIWLACLLVITAVAFYKFFSIDKTAGTLYFVYLLWLILLSY